VAEHAINSITLHPGPDIENIRLKEPWHCMGGVGKPLASTSQETVMIGGRGSVHFPDRRTWKAGCIRP
jgi:hypothetical protein